MVWSMFWIIILHWLVRAFLSIYGMNTWDVHMRSRDKKEIVLELSGKMRQLLGRFVDFIFAFLNCIAPAQKIFFDVLRRAWTQWIDRNMLTNPTHWKSAKISQNQSNAANWLLLFDFYLLASSYRTVLNYKNKPNRIADFQWLGNALSVFWRLLTNGSVVDPKKMLACIIYTGCII